MVSFPLWVRTFCLSVSLHKCRPFVETYQRWDHTEVSFPPFFTVILTLPVFSCVEFICIKEHWRKCWCSLGNKSWITSWIQISTTLLDHIYEPRLPWRNSILYLTWTTNVLVVNVYLRPLINAASALSNGTATLFLEQP